MNPEAENPETPEQKKARLDAVLPEGDPRHPNHEAWRARNAIPNRPQNLLLQIIRLQEQEDQQQNPATPWPAEGL